MSWTTLIIVLIIWSLVSIPVAFFMGYLFSRRPDPTQPNAIVVEGVGTFESEEAYADWVFDDPEGRYDVELGIDEPLNHNGDGVWEEVEIDNDCGYGCKIYQHTKTGRRALAHNSAYGCKRSFNLIKE